MKNKTTNNKVINITQVKSAIGRNKIQKQNLISLGLKKIGSSRSIIINKSTEGLIKKINHLVKIEKGNGFEDLKDLIEKKGMEIIDTSEDVVTIEIRGDQRDIEGMIEMFDQFGIKEIARTGTVALERGSKKTT